MLELLNNAIQGWNFINGQGKLTALLFLVLLFLGIMKYAGEQQVLYWYTLGVTAICVIPVTASFCMVYQTRFYDYQWIWTYVPMTMMVSYGGVCFLRYCMGNASFTKVHKGVILLTVIALLCFCSNMGNQNGGIRNGISEWKETKTVLDKLAPAGGQECLWGPRELMESARAVRGDMKLLYGKNMWDKSLNAYSYDTYSEKLEMCFGWMSYLDGSRDNKALGQEIQWDDNQVIMGCVEEAKRCGVTILCIPAGISSQVLNCLEADCNIKFIHCTEQYLCGRLATN